MAWYFLRTEKIALDLQIEGVFWDGLGRPRKFSRKSQHPLEGAF